MKKLFTAIIVAVMLAVCVMPFTACDKIVKLNFEIEYLKINEEDEGLNETVTETLTFDIYEHLAPKAVSAIREQIKNGKFENVVFYREQEDPAKLNVGGYKLVDGNYVARENLYIADAEFEKNGTIGSELKVEYGSICLWREFEDGNYNVNSPDVQKTVDTFFMPTADNSDYDGWFCVLGKTEDTEMLSALSLLLSNSEYYTTYFFFNDGEADVQMSEEDYEDYLLENETPEDVKEIRFSTSVIIKGISIK